MISYQVHGADSVQVYITPTMLYVSVLMVSAILGMYGVVTEVTFKIRPLPSVRKYGSVVFSEFSLGVSFMRGDSQAQVRPGFYQAR